MKTVVEQVQPPAMFGQWLTRPALPPAPSRNCYSEFVCSCLLCQTEFLALGFEPIRVGFAHCHNISHEYSRD